MTDLRRLAKPFPAKIGDTVIIKQTPGRGSSYVEHTTYNQWLLGIVGPFSFEIVQLIRGSVDGLPATKDSPAKPTLSDVVVGALCKLTVTIDNRKVIITEIGDVGFPHNRKNDGERAKDAASDGFKRCCMRIGLGLHLWTDGPAEYHLHDLLTKREEEEGSKGKQSED